MSATATDLQLSITAVSGVKPGLATAQADVAAAARSMRTHTEVMGTGARNAGKEVVGLGEKMRLFARSERREAGAARYFVNELGGIVSMSGGVKMALSELGQMMVGGLGLTAAIGAVVTGVAILTNAMAENKKEAKAWAETLATHAKAADEAWAKIRGERGPKKTASEGVVESLNKDLQDQIDKLEKEKSEIVVGGFDDFMAGTIWKSSDEQKAKVEGKIQELRRQQQKNLATGDTEAGIERGRNDQKLAAQTAMLQAESMVDGVAKDRAVAGAKLLERLEEIDREWTGIASADAITKLKEAEVAKAGAEAVAAAKKISDAYNEGIRELQQAGIKQTEAMVAQLSVYVSQWATPKQGLAESLYGIKDPRNLGPTAFSPVTFGGNVEVPSLVSSELTAEGAGILGAADDARDKKKEEIKKLTLDVASTWIDALTMMLGETKITVHSMIKLFVQLAGQMMQQAGFSMGGPIAGLFGALATRAVPKAHGGWDIPKGLGEVPMIGKGGEMMLGEAEANVIRSLAKGGGAGPAPVNVTINAIDGQSVRDWIVRNGTDFTAGVRELSRQGR